MFVRTLPLDKDSSVTDRTSEFFDRYAGGFNAIYGNANGPFESIVNRLFRQAMVKRYEKTLAGCQPIEGRTVIDVGCGPGHYGVALASAGAAHVLGLDFAPGMLTLAEQAAKARRVAERCTFVLGDFLTYPIPERFDYVIVMGFMDYMSEPRKIIEKVLSLTASKAFLSFPAAGGFLAWQRKMRYKSRCDLFLYNEQQLRELCAKFPAVRAKIEPIARDYFVTLDVV